MKIEKKNKEITLLTLEILTLVYYRLVTITIDNVNQPEKLSLDKSTICVLTDDENSH